MAEDLSHYGILGGLKVEAHEALADAFREIMEVESEQARSACPKEKCELYYSTLPQSGEPEGSLGVRCGKDKKSCVIRADECKSRILEQAGVVQQRVLDTINE